MPVEGIEQWGEIGGRLKTAAVWFICRVPLVHEGRSARGYSQ